mgnify:FL=1
MKLRRPKTPAEREAAAMLALAVHRYGMDPDHAQALAARFEAALDAAEALGRGTAGRDIARSEAWRRREARLSRVHGAVPLVGGDQ